MAKETSSNGCTTTKKCRIISGVIVTLVLAAIIAVVVVFTTRPANLEVTESTAVESLPSLIKGVTIGTGAIAIEFTELLADKMTLSYYVALNGDLDATIIQDELDLENPTLYLVPNLSSMQSLLRVGQLNNVTFPYRLSESFLPGDFEGLVLAEADRMDDDRSFIAPFQIVDASHNVGTPTRAPVSLSPTKSPTTAPTISPAPTMNGATKAPTALPTLRPTLPPVAPTNPPVASPTSPPLPEVLVGSLDGNYNIEGTITIDYVTGLENGQVVDIARLQFDVGAVRAPGPFLYLSKRPYSETQGGDLVAEDIAIDIEGVADGSFTKGGVFEQVLDEINNVQDLREYEGGSFIVWCRPFGVWLGGGPIMARN